MTVQTALTVRVWVPAVWDTVELTVSPETTVADLKRQALTGATGRPLLDPSSYQVKFRGARVFDETQTLAALHAPDHAPFIVLPNRRQPVR